MTTPDRPPPCKRYLSYLSELHIESAPSKDNPHLSVSLIRGRYQLSTANAVYSYEDLYDNFFDAFRRTAFHRLPGRRALLLGLGLGSIPLMLEQHFQRQFQYTAVEIDESVIYLAQKYVLSRLSAPMELIAADAFAFVQQCQERFDLIAMDVFLDDIIPDHFKTVDFLQQLADLLEPNGLLLYNCLAYTPKDIAQAQQFYESTFQTVFKSGTYLPLRVNWMFFSDQDILLL